MPSVAALTLVGLVVGMASCEPIDPRPLIDPPVNTCPCDRYEPGATTAARCSERNRCEILTPGGRPEYKFWIVVHVPDSSYFAPGSTFVLPSDAAFKEPDVVPGVVPRNCRPSRGCLLLGVLVGVSGSYKVTSDVARYVGYPLPDRSSIPVRLVYEALGKVLLTSTELPETLPRLPLDVLFGASRLTSGPVEFARAVPAGRYRRVFYPQPPFDELFPPVTDDKNFPTSFAQDEIILGGDKPLDDMNGSTRIAKVTREAGLDGWRVWLEDRSSHRRISVVRRLSGTEAEVELYTAIGKSLGAEDVDVDAVVAPPESWTAMPRYVTNLIAGSGLQSLDYPVIPPPVAVAGVVAEPTKSPTDPLFGYPARITFEGASTGLSTDKPLSSPSDNDLSPLLQYSTTVSTDVRGRFATVLPPGNYTVTIEPAVGTGYATKKEFFTVDRTLTTRTFQPPPLTHVTGRAVITDGRPLSDAEVIAVPNTKPNQTNSEDSKLLTTSAPRPGRARTGDDGRFTLELDPGPYLLSVIPKAGTGFPRVVVRPEIPSSPTELPEIRVPAPTRLAFELRHPSPLTGNFVKDAVVRIFAQPRLPGGGLIDPELAVEIGSGMTDAEGKVEILLAQEPR